MSNAHPNAYLQTNES